MARYTIEDGDGNQTVVDTTKATDHWEEETQWDGRNHISRATGSQWEHETLYRSAKGRFYVEHTSQWQGSTDTARFVSAKEAAAWLLANEHDLPEELEAAGAEVCE
jgi:uncharacterized protein YxjI